MPVIGKQKPPAAPAGDERTAAKENDAEKQGLGLVRGRWLCEGEQRTGSVLFEP